MRKALLLLLCLGCATFEEPAQDTQQKAASDNCDLTETVHLLAPNATNCGHLITPRDPETLRAAMEECAEKEFSAARSFVMRIETSAWGRTIWWKIWDGKEAYRLKLLLSTDAEDDERLPHASLERGSVFRREGRLSIDSEQDKTLVQGTACEVLAWVKSRSKGG